MNQMARATAESIRAAATNAAKASGLADRCSWGPTSPRVTSVWRGLCTWVLNPLAASCATRRLEIEQAGKRVDAIMLIDKIHKLHAVIYNYVPYSVHLYYNVPFFNDAPHAP